MKKMINKTLCLILTLALLCISSLSVEAEENAEATLINIYSLEPTFMTFLSNTGVESLQKATQESDPHLDFHLRSGQLIPILI